MEENKIERIILVILGISSISTFSIALLMGYNLFISDVVGFGGFLIVTIFYFLKRDLLLPALSILLILGMLNLASFVYFVNLRISFGFLGKAFTPGIQFYSLVLFFILVLFRRLRYMEWLNKLIGKSEENVKEDHQTGVALFRQKFSSLTEEEIQKKLKLSLSEDARIALQQLMDEKKK